MPAGDGGPHVASLSRRVVRVFVECSIRLSRVELDTLWPPHAPPEKQPRSPSLEGILEHPLFSKSAMTSKTPREQEARIALRLLDAFALEGPAVTSLRQDWLSLMETKLHVFYSCVLNLKGPILKRKTMPATQDGMSDGAQGEGMAEVPLTAGTLDWHEDATHSRESICPRWRGDSCSEVRHSPGGCSV